MRMQEYDEEGEEKEEGEEDGSRGRRRALRITRPGYREGPEKHPRRGGPDEFRRAPTSSPFPARERALSRPFLVSPEQGPESFSEGPVGLFLVPPGKKFTKILRKFSRNSLVEFRRVPRISLFCKNSPEILRKILRDIHRGFCPAHSFWCPGQTRDADGIVSVWCLGPGSSVQGRKGWFWVRGPQGSSGEAGGGARARAQSALPPSSLVPPALPSSSAAVRAAAPLASALERVSASKTTDDFGPRASRWPPKSRARRASRRRTQRWRRPRLSRRRKQGFCSAGAELPLR